MKPAVLAGLFYFGIVFLFGFLLGFLRSLVLAPVLGETWAVVIEWPVMVILSWMVSRNLIDRFRVPRRRRTALVMGGLALVLLLGAEAGLSAVLGRTFLEHLRLYQAAPGIIGLTGQFLFALFPILQVRLSLSRHR